jgi:hypothetical protein
MTEHEIMMAVGNIPTAKLKEARDMLRMQAGDLEAAIKTARRNLSDVYRTIAILQRRAYVQEIDID